MTESILDEYVRITRIIDNIQNKLTQYKKETDILIEKANTKEERENILSNFKIIMDDIKRDHIITNKYRLLRQKQLELKNQLIRPIFGNVDETIQNMKIKYNYSNITPVVDEIKLKTNELVSNEQIDIVLNNIKNKIDNPKKIYKNV